MRALRFILVVLAITNATPAAALADQVSAPGNGPGGLAGSGPLLDAKCAALYDPATNTYRYLKNPDRPCWTGSKAKALTIDVALQAVNDGQLSFDDAMAFSEESTNQACNCLGGYATNLPSGTGIDPADWAAPGDVMNFKDALFGITMSAVEPTVTTAELVANKLLHGTKAPGSSVRQSQQLREEFVEMMNDRFDDLGLTQSWFSNEHGGWQGLWGLPNPKATAREMARFWAHAMEASPHFLDILGLRNKTVTTTKDLGPVHPPQIKEYGFSKSYGYYPGAQGDKGGDVKPPNSPWYRSLVGSSERVGRTLTFDVAESTESARADSGRLLAYGFGQIFRPDDRGDSSNQAATVRDQNVDCWSSGRCLTAVATSSRRLKLVSWTADVGDQTVERLEAAEIPETGVDEVDVAHLGVATVPDAPIDNVSAGSRREPAPGSGPGELSAPRTTGSASAAGGAGGGKPGKRIAITAERRGAELRLRAWSIGSAGQVTPLGGAAGTPAGDGSDISIQRLNVRRFVTAAHEASSGKLRVRSWYVSNAGQITELDSATTANPIGGAPAMAAMGSPLGVVTSVQASSGREALISWRVDPASGELTRTGDTGNKGTSGLDRLRVVRTSTGRYLSTGIVAGKARVTLWSLTTGGRWTKRGDATDIPAANVSDLSLASLGTDAGVLATRAQGKLRLYAIEVDEEYETYNHVERYHVLSEVAGANASMLDLARVATDDATGDYVLALRTGSDRLRLHNWRVAANP